MDFPTQEHMLKAMGYRTSISLANCGANAAAYAPIAELLDAQFCLTPTVPDNELAEASVTELVNGFQVDETTCKHIKEMHRRMIASDNASTGSGSWPPGKQCHPQKYPIDNSHACLVYSDHDDLMANNSLNREVTDQEWQKVVVDAKVWPSIEKPVASVAECKKRFVYPDSDVGAKRAARVNRKIGQVLNVLDMGHWLAREATRRVGCFLIEVFDGPNGVHGIHMRTYPMPGSLAGLGYFPDGTCGDHVTCNVDSLISYGLGWFAGLTTHELGHTLDFRHEFSSPQSKHRSVMSYATENEPFQGYRKDGAPYRYPEDHSWPKARKVFGGDAAIALPGDDADDDVIVIPGGERLELDLDIATDDRGRPIILNEFEVMGRKFIIVPRPKI